MWVMQWKQDDKAVTVSPLLVKKVSAENKRMGRAKGLRGTVKV